MKQSEQARREAIVDQEKKEQKLVQGERQEGHWPNGQHAPQKDQGFDRSHQGAPRADDRSIYNGQSAYGSLESAHENAEFTERQTDSALETRGGLSSYGTSLGSQYGVDQPDTSQQAASASLSSPGSARGAASESTDGGQYAGQYDNNPQRERSTLGESDAAIGVAASAVHRGSQHDADSAAPNSELRGDQQLKEEIHQRLMEHPDLDIHDLSVALRDGHATLEGSVPEAHMREVIVQLVDNVNGVLKIDDRITVQHVNPASHATAQAYAASAVPSDDRQQSGPLTFGAASAKASALKQQQGEKTESGSGEGGATDGKS